MAFYHQSVLLEETVRWGFTVPGEFNCGLYHVEGGALGKIASKIGSGAGWSVFDQDEAAVRSGREKFAGDREVIIFQRNYCGIAEDVGGKQAFCR